MKNLFSLILLYCLSAQAVIGPFPGNESSGSGGGGGVTIPVPISQGGTGQTTQQAAIDALLPSQTGNSGKYLTTNGSTSSWGTVSASPGGSNTQIQYNNSGSFGGASSFTYTSATGTLSLAPTGSPTTLFALSYSGLSTATNGLLLSGTFPNAAHQSIYSNMTGSSSTSVAQYNFRAANSAGSYTTSTVIGYGGIISSVNTGNSFGGFNVANQGNFGSVIFGTTSNTTGLGVGITAMGYGSRYQVGGNFVATGGGGTTPKAMGVRGVATQEGSANSLAVYGRLNQALDTDTETAFPAYSSAALFDNGDTTSPIITAVDDGVSNVVWQVADGGAQTWNLTTNAGNSDVLTLTNGPTGKAGNPIYIPITVNGVTRYLAAW